MADYQGVQGENKQGAFLICAVELFAIQLKEVFGKGHCASAAQIWGFGKGPVDGEFHHPGGFSVGDEFVGFVHGHEAAVIEKAFLAQQTYSVLAEGPGWCTITYRTLSHSLRQVVNCLIE